MNKHIINWWIPLILLSFISFYIQTYIFVYKDVLYLMHAAKLMLSGGSYLTDFFETNPPLIMYLYMPVIIFAKLTSIDNIILLRIYIITLAFFSISVSHFLIRRIVENNKSLLFSLSYSLIFILLFLPASQLGQREHLLLIFTLPYLFLMVLRLENKLISPYIAIFIGILAGFGFALKPYFLPPLILIELYYIYKKRNLLAWIRIESMIILSLLLAYLAIISTLHLDYIENILPMVSRLYFIGVEQPWIGMLSLPPVIFCFLCIGLYFLSGKENHYPIFSTVLVLALVGFILSFLIPRVAWHYHVYPALGIACLLLTLLTTQLIATLVPIFSKKTYDIILITVFSLLVFFIPFSFTTSLFKETITEKSEGHENDLIHFFKNQTANATYDCFSVSDDHMLFEGYANATYTGRFPFFWWRAGILALETKIQDKKTNQQLEKDKYYLAHLLATTLNQKKPRFIIIDMTSAKLHFGIDIDYVKELSQYPSFTQVWKNYQYYSTIDHYRIYQLRTTTSHLNH